MIFALVFGHMFVRCFLKNLKKEGKSFLFFQRKIHFFDVHVMVDLLWTKVALSSLGIFYESFFYGKLSWTRMISGRVFWLEIEEFKSEKFNLSYVTLAFSTMTVSARVACLNLSFSNTTYQKYTASSTGPVLIHCLFRLEKKPI